MEKEKIPKESGEISRREFLKDAGLVVGGAAISSTILLAACGGGEGETATVTKTQTVTTTAGAATQTVTTTAGAATQTVTTTAPGVTKFICPIDGQEFSTLSALQAHFESAHPEEKAIPGLLTLTVNGKTREVYGVKPYYTLAFVLREKLGLVGTKVGCNLGECGTCTIIVDGKPVYPCIMLAMDAEGKDVLTIEGLADGLTLHPVQQKFYNLSAVQCGYCTPGFIMAAVALLDENPDPTLDEVKVGLSGHMCTCGHTTRIVEAVLGGY